MISKLRQFNNTFDTASVVLPILFFLLMISGTPLFEALRLTVVLLIQISAGVQCWNILFPKWQHDLMLTIGAGTTIGICLATFSQQLLLHTPLNSVAWIVPFVFFFVVTLTHNQNDSCATNHYVISKENLFLLLTSLTMFGLLDQWWWLFPLFTVSALSYIVVKLNIPSLGNLSSRFLRLSLVTLLVCVAIPVSISLRKLNTLWWIISNDTVFFESLSFSLNKWGRNADISALGESVMYHWFSYAWSGMTTEISGAESWTVLTLLLPIISCVAISSLTWSLVKELTGSTRAALIACLMLLTMRNVISSTSPSQILSIAIVLTILAASKHSLSENERNFSRSILFLGLVFVLFGTKISSGAVYVGGIVITLIISKDLKLKIRLVLIISAIFSAFLSYRYFFGDAEGSIKPKISFDDFGWSLLFDRAIGGGSFHLLFDLIAFLLVFAPYLAVLLFAFSMRDENKNDSVYYALTSALLLGVGATSLIDANGTESYFLHSAAVALIILTVSLSSSILRRDSGFFIRRFVILLSIVGFVVGYLAPILVRYFKTLDSNSLLLTAVPQIMVVFVCVALSVSFALISRNKIGFRFSFIFFVCVTLMSSVIGQNLNARVSFAKSLFSLEGARKEQFTDFNFFAGSPQRVEALSWLKDNSDEDVIVATNRKCLSISFCGPEKWFLASAISHRQMLMEGYFYSVGVYPKLKWAEERIDISERFVDGPKSPDASFTTSDASERFAIRTKMQDYEFLKDNGVDFVIVDFEFIFSHTLNDWELPKIAQTKNWEPFATTVFKNAEMAILKLN